MIPVSPARRRADEFQSLVEASSTSGRTDTGYAELLELVGGLRAAPEATAAAATPRPEFVASLREQLMTAAATELVGPVPGDRLTPAVTTPRRRRRERRIAAAVGGLAVLGATTSMAVAAQSALPGQPLYPVKRAIENAHVGLQTAEDAKGTTILENASGRLVEVNQLTEDTRDADTITDTLYAFTSQATEASDWLLAAYAHTGEREAIEELRRFTRESMAALESLEGRVPAEARAALMLAAQVLSQIDAQALQACPSCGGPAVVPAPDLFLGALSAPVQEGQAQTEASPAIQRNSPRGHRAKQRDDKAEEPSSRDQSSGDTEEASEPQSQPPLPSSGDSGSTSSDGGGSSAQGDDDGSGSLSDPVDKVIKGGTSTDSTRSGLRDVVGGVRDTVDDTTDSLLP